MHSQWSFHHRDAPAAEATWHPTPPPASPDVTRLAALLLPHAPIADTLVVQPDGTIWQLHVEDDAVHLTETEPDARVAPFDQPEPDDLADLLTWAIRADLGPHPSISPAIWRALHADHWLAQRIRAYRGLEHSCLLYEGAGEMRDWAANTGVTLIEVLWEDDDNAPVDQHDLGWQLLRWVQSPDVGWRGVRAVVPARGYLGRLVSGEAGGAEALCASLTALATHHHSVPLSLLVELAPALDRAGIAHGLRHGEARVVDDESGGVARIELTTDGLVWHHPPLTDLAEIELARLAFGAAADVVPAAMKAACIDTLRQTPTAANKALWWWQHGADIEPERLAASSDLGDALMWAETRLATPGAVLPAAWLQGLLTLAATRVSTGGALDPEVAARIATIVGRSGADGAIGLQVLAFAPVESRDALLMDAGLSLTEQPRSALHVLDQIAPVLLEIRHG